MCKLSIFLKRNKNAESSENSKIFKDNGDFWTPHPQISLKQYANICENIVYLTWLLHGTVCRGAEECQRAEDKTITLKKCKKNG